MKVVHKGIVIVFAPLVIQVAIVLSFRFALESVQKQILSAERSRDVVAAGDSFRREMLREGMLAYLNRCHPSEDLVERMTETTRRIHESLDELDRLSKGHKDEQEIIKKMHQRARIRLEIKRLMDNLPDGVSTLEIAQGSPGIAATFIEGSERQAARLFDIESHNAYVLPLLIRSISKQLLGTLVIGSLFSVFSIVIGYFVAREIGKRLRQLQDNAWRLVAGTPLVAPTPGDDEIAILDQTLYQSAKELKDNEEFRQGIIGIVSHELRTPMTSLSATINALTVGLIGTIGQGAENTLRTCAQTATRVISMISNLLDAEMIESGKLGTSNDSVNLHSIIQSSLFVVEELVKPKNASIDSRVPADAVISGNADQMTRLIEELISIALEHCVQGSLIEIDTARDPLCFSITYEGEAPVQTGGNTRDDTASDLPSRLRWSLCQELCRINGKRLIAETSGGRQSLIVKLARKDDAVLSIRQELPLMTSTTKARGWLSLERKWLICLLPVLLTQCLFVGTMFVLGSQIQKELESEFRAWELIAQANRVTTSLAVMTSSVVGFRTTADPVIVARRSRYKETARKELEQLKKKLNVDNEEKRQFINGLEQSQLTIEKLYETSLVYSVDLGIDTMLTEEEQKSLQVSMKGILDPISQFINRQKDLQFKNRAAALDTRKKIEQAIAIAFGVSALTGLICFVSLRSTISGPINHLIDSSRKLASRSQMPPVLKGNDEFAQIDRILHFIDQRFSQFESFKRETSMLMGQHLKQALNTICDGIEDLLNGGALKQESNNRLHNLLADCRRLIRLVDDFLSARMMEAGKFDIRLQLVNTSEIVDIAILSVEQLARKGRITIDKPSESFVLQCDRDRVTQVIINFLSNAIKFSEPNSIVSVDVIEADDSVEFQVIDRGRGIAADEIEKLFQKYEQSQSADWHGKRGSGLGLYISKSIVEAHGGEIGVSSEAGEGSTFWASIPRGLSGEQEHA